MKKYDIAFLIERLEEAQDAVNDLLEENTEAMPLREAQINNSIKLISSDVEKALKETKDLYIVI